MTEAFALSAWKQQAFKDAMHRLGREAELAVSVPFFSPDEIGTLKDEASRLPMRRASAQAGGRRVAQDFDICFPAPREGALDALATLLEGAVADMQAGVREEEGAEILPAMPAFCLNDVAVQCYHKGSGGIGIHRDALRYHGLVFIITLAGASRFCLCDDREGGGVRVLDDSPGRLTILSAPGFKGWTGEAVRPLHFVDQVDGGRLSIGLRYDSKAA